MPMRWPSAFLLSLFTVAAAAAEIPLTQPTPLIPSAEDATEAAASDGRGFFVLFSHGTINRGVKSFQGIVGDVTADLGEAEGAAVAAGDDGYLVVLERGTSVTARRISRGGAE